MRLVAASESLAIGFGGTSQVSRQTGVSRRAIYPGNQGHSTKPQVCKGAEYAVPGGCRKRTVDKDASLKTDLERLVDPASLGAIPSLRCVGRARACANWRKNSTWTWPCRPVMDGEPSCCMNWAIACRPTARPWKGPAMRPRPAIPASTSMSPSFCSSSPSFQSIPRRKSWWAISNHGAADRPKGDPEPVR